MPRARGSTTYLVPEQYAIPRYIDKFWIEEENWEKVAHKVIPGGDWNPIEECLWSEMPYFAYVLEDGTPIRYGLSRTQSIKHPDRELWCIAINAIDGEKINWRDRHLETFVVDKVCVNPSFLEKIGTDIKKWMEICWAHPTGIEPWDALIEDDFLFPNLDKYI